LFAGGITVSFAVCFCRYILAEGRVDGGTADLIAWTLTDHLNTVRDIAKYDPQTGATTVVNHLVYDAFGKVTSESNPAVESLFLFTARPFDADTGLQNNLNRWYDPRVGRWLSEDPIGFMAGDGNLYRFCANSPTTGLDPNGYQRIPNPGFIYNWNVRRLGRGAAKRTVDVMEAHFLQAHIGSSPGGDTERDIWVGPLIVNSSIAEAMGFPLSRWVNAQKAAERMSTDSCKVRVFGETTLSAYWRPVRLLDTKTSISYTGYRIDYFVAFWQTVTVTNETTGQVCQQTGAIFVSSRTAFIVSGIGVVGYDEAISNYTIWRR